MRVPVQPRTLAQLQEITTPAPIAGGNMEVYRHVLYDTQTYPAAGVAQLTFFATTNPDASLNNLEVGGSLPDPDYAQLWYGRIVPILGQSSATVTRRPRRRRAARACGRGRPRSSRSHGPRPRARRRGWRSRSRGGPTGRGTR